MVATLQCRIWCSCFWYLNVASAALGSQRERREEGKTSRRTSSQTPEENRFLRFVQFTASVLTFSSLSVIKKNLVTLFYCQKMFHTRTFLVSSLHFHFQRELIPRCLTYNNDTSLIVAEEPERVGLSRDTKNSPLRSLWGVNKNLKKAFWKQTLMDWISWRRAEIYIYFFNYSIMLSETAVCVWEAACTDWNLFCTFFGNFSLYW